MNQVKICIYEKISKECYVKNKKIVFLHNILLISGSQTVPHDGRTENYNLFISRKVFLFLIAFKTTYL